jgi:ribosomal protein L11 methylase PrmA
VNSSYSNNYDALLDSGLYEDLVKSNLLIPHEEWDIEPPRPNNSYKIIKPELIPFISYPYEWCFSQLKHAALTTLEIQKKALEYEMTLKDATSYNIQFKKGKPILIDTLSFEKYKEGQPWTPYRQFCQHFLAPLALMSYKDIRLNQLLRIYIDGIPLDLTSSLLPLKTRSMFSLLAHIHAHAKSQKRYESKEVKGNDKKIGKRSFEGIIASLYSGIKKLGWGIKDTEWGSYYSDTNYTDSAFENKKIIIKTIIEKSKPNKVWDLGANTGIFSRIASNNEIDTVAFDVDPAAVEKNFLECVDKREENLLPLLIDLTNPSPYLGWEHQERKSFVERGPVDLVMALALIHHLAISNNLPLSRLAQFFAKISNHLIIEFIPKTDSQVKRLLATREDIFDDYTKEQFEKEFQEFFTIVHTHEIPDSVRILYHMKLK